MSRMAWLWALVAVALTLGLGAVAWSIGQARPAPPPSEAQALAALDQAVALARTGGFTALCAMGGLDCQTILDEAGRDAVPDAAPAVYATRAVEPSMLPGGDWDLGGRILAVCGTDGRGRPYRGEVVVFQDGSALRMIEPIYWAGISIGSAASPVTPASPLPQGGCPAGY